MSNDIPSNGSAGAKALGALVAIVALIAGVYAMVEPMGQRIDFLERHIEKMEERMTARDITEKEATAVVSRFQEKFAEVETQFGALKDIGIKTEERTNARLGKLESRFSVIEPEMIKTQVHSARLEEKTNTLNMLLQELRCPPRHGSSK